MPEALQIASLILHCRPERLPAVKANLALLDGLEIYQESPQGKLILVLEAEREEQILDTLGQLQNLPGVLNAVLVYCGLKLRDDGNLEPARAARTRASCSRAWPNTTRPANPTPPGCGRSSATWTRW